MEERGLIMRQQDWKTKYLSLTDEGTTFYEEVVPQQEQFQIDQFAELDTADQKELLRLLNILHKQGEN